MKIAMLGDIGFFGKYTFENNNDIKTYFKDVSKFLSTFDLVVGNLETPFVGELKPKLIKSACIGAKNKNVNLLKFLNVDLVNLANNHLLDYGKQGYDNTIKLLEKNNINYFGVEDKNFIYSKGNNKIIFHGYCAYNSSPYGIYTEKKGYGINALNIEKINKKLELYNSQGYFNILSSHSGQEHVNYPSYEDIKMARGFSKLCPYIYYGHHPHVIQGVEFKNESLIAYSLGNFCFDDIYTDKSKEPLVVQTKNNKSSFILEVEISENKIISYKTTPIFAGEKGIEIGSEKIENNINKYSEALNLDKDEYITKRKTLISNFIAKRKTQRDFNWYFKRLNYKSIIRIYDAKSNIRKQYENVSKYLLDD